MNEKANLIQYCALEAIQKNPQMYVDQLEQVMKELAEEQAKNERLEAEIERLKVKQRGGWK